MRIDEGAEGPAARAALVMRMCNHEVVDPRPLKGGISFVAYDKVLDQIVFARVVRLADGPAGRTPRKAAFAARRWLRGNKWRGAYRFDSVTVNDRLVTEWTRGRARTME